MGKQKVNSDWMGWWTSGWVSPWFLF